MKKDFFAREIVIYLQPFLNDLIAQQVEHLPFKERVLGSSPSQVTKVPYLTGFFSCPGAEIGRQAWLRAMCSYERAGSIPALGTKDSYNKDIIIPYYFQHSFLHLHKLLVQ